MCCSNTVRLLSVVFSVGKCHPGCSAGMEVGSVVLALTQHTVLSCVFSFPSSSLLSCTEQYSQCCVSCSSAHPELLLSVSILSRCRIFLRLKHFTQIIFLL